LNKNLKFKTNKIFVMFDKTFNMFVKTFTVCHKIFDSFEAEVEFVSIGSIISIEKKLMRWQL
jgi:hypothetical protein